MTVKNMPWGIHRLADMIGDDNAQTQDSLGCWVRAVPLPYHLIGIREKITAVWWVLTGRAHVVIWPDAGDLELALGICRVPKDKPND